MKADRKNVLDRLGELLAAERAAILSGELHVLSQMSEETRNCLEILATGDGVYSAGKLADIQKSAQDNERLLQSTLSGIRSARARMEAIRKVEDGFDTYDRDGTTRSVSFGDGRLERRA